jgi:hypothetical protein
MIVFHERVRHGIFFSMRNASGPGGPRKGRVLRCRFPRGRGVEVIVARSFKSRQKAKVIA